MRFIDYTGRWAALVCTDINPIYHTRLLMPIRIQIGNASSAFGELMEAEIVRQTLNLRNKIAGLDRLRLAATIFKENFSAARIFLFGNPCKGEQEDWCFCRQVLRTVQDYTQRAVVSQLDYDQRRLHPTVNSILDSIEFATAHQPSAVATVTCFRTVLRCLGVRQERTSWGVKGAGDLGSRIVRCIANDAQAIFVAEILSDRRAEMAQLANVSLIGSSDLLSVPADAVIFSADFGSLNAFTAHKIAVNSHIRIVGGPEAGLDRDRSAMYSLAASGKWFIPSVLCGSLGLVSNLEEALGHSIDLQDQTRKLAHAVGVMADQAMDRHIPFHEVCRSVLQGIDLMSPPSP